MFIGTPSKPITLEPENSSISIERSLQFGFLDVLFSTVPRRMGIGSLLPETKQIRVEKLIDRRIGMESIAEAFEDLKVPGKIKGKILMEV